MAKRFFDIVAAAIGLLFLSPILFFIALCIRREDSDPVFYCGVRVGLRGKPFRIFKFRTMVVNAEKTGCSSTSDDDPRITHIGKKLRKYKLDELPQLINVLKGDMSLVGPRPEVPQYVNLFTEEEKRILSVRPGITDWACLWNSDEGALLAGSTNPDKDYMEKIRPEKIRLQLKYVREQSFRIDLAILLRTAMAIMPFRRGNTVVTARILHQDVKSSSRNVGEARSGGI
jgi:lipopolysaccharide/colanic/teichoic acid biosynthesis glycosyltransferase